MLIRSGGGEGVKGTGIGVDVGIIAVRVNVGGAGINVVVGIATEGLHAQTLSNRIVETSSLDLLNNLTLLSIPLTRQFGSGASQFISFDGSIPSIFPVLPVCPHSHSRRRCPRRGTAIRTGPCAHEFKRPGHQLRMHLE